MTGTRMRLRGAVAALALTVMTTTALGTAAAATGPVATAVDLAVSDAPRAGTVAGWGLDIGYGATTVPHGVDDVVAVDAHSYLAAAVRADGTAAAWVAGPSDWDFAAWAAGLTDVAELTVGGRHMVARHTDGSLSTHGWDAFGQSTVPEGLTDVVAVEAGDSHNLALRADGTVVAWGYEDDGATLVPDGLDDVVAISAGTGHNLAVRADGTVVAWGRDESGQASPPDGLDEVVAVAASLVHSVALRADGTVVAWGSRNLSTVPDGLDDVVAVAAGDHTLALRADGTVVAWGSPFQTWGGSTSVPIGLDSVVDVAVGGPYSLVVVEAGAASPLPDTTPPEIRHKGTITKAATSPRGARIWFTPTATDEVFADPSLSCSAGRGDWFPLGTTTVMCEAQDWAGNRSHASYDVRVR